VSKLNFEEIHCRKNLAVKVEYFIRLDKVDFNFQLTVRLINFLSFIEGSPKFFNSFPLFFVLAALQLPSNSFLRLSKKSVLQVKRLSFTLLLS